MRLELRGIGKAYPGVIANAGIDLRIDAGEIHAVLGENGAGKSTLMKIVSGVVSPDTGEILWDGRPVRIDTPARAQSLGIAMVHQHFALFESLTAVENIALALPGRLDRRGLARRIDAIASRYQLPIEPYRHVHSMSIGERQRVEIVRCLLQSPSLLILDEPTSVLTPLAVEGLFATVRKLAQDGCAVLYISHKLEEVRALCSRATVLRQGRKVGEVDPRVASARALAELMIGSSLPDLGSGEARAGRALLVVDRLTRPAAEPYGTDLHGIELAVREGEVVGIAGVSGNGQQELLAALSGERPGNPKLEAASTIRLVDRDANWLDAGARRDLGLAFVPEERLGKGAVPAMSLADNAVLTGWRLGMIRGPGLLDRRAADAFARRCIDDFEVRATGADASADSLSGGNLQKYIVAREILVGARVMLLAQPTWGVDVGAAAMIRQRIRGLASASMGVLLVSDDLEELFETCDRIAVMCQGRLSALRATRDTSPDEIGLWMAGLWPGGPGIPPEPPAPRAAPGAGAADREQLSGARR